MRIKELTVIIVALLLLIPLSSSAFSNPPEEMKPAEGYFTLNTAKPGKTARMFRQPGSMDSGFTVNEDIPLPPELQEHIFTVSEKYGIDHQVFLGIIERESRFQQNVPDNINRNGTRDRGLCQINSGNWGWLMADYGLDVSDPYDNIECSAVMLSMYLEKYPVEQALACYNAGEGGMKQGKGREYAADVLYRAGQFV